MSRMAAPVRNLRPRGPRGVVRSGLGVALIAAAATVSVAADPLVYRLEIRDREAARYTLELPVRNPGALQVNIEWSGSRTLSFRIEGPGSPAVKTRRAGPSPQQLVAEVTDLELATSKPWTLHIHSLSDRGTIDGVLTVTLPPAPGLYPETEEAQLAPPPPPPDPWLLPDVAPRDASDGLVRVFETSEGFREWAVVSQGVPRNDACGWQADLLRYLAARRNALRDGQSEDIEEATSRFMLRVAKAVRLVDELRSSEDPILSGPMPEHDLQQRAWLAVRKRRIEPVEAELDALNSLLRGEFAPQLVDETWPQRLVGCLTACERYFEQRTRLGTERAASASLAFDQWDGILAAAGALEALASVGADPAVVANETPSTR